MKKLTSIILPLCTVFLFSACAEDSNDNNNKKIEPVVSEGLSDNAILHDTPKLNGDGVNFKSALDGSAYMWTITDDNNERIVVDYDSHWNPLYSSDKKEITVYFSNSGTYTVNLKIDEKEYNGQIIIPTTNDYEIDMGANHTIISDKSQKRLFVYGSNENGQLCANINENKFVTIPRVLKFNNNVTMSSVAAGNKHTLFTDNNYIYSCGNNSYGQLGTGNTNEVSNMTTVSFPSNILYNRIFVSAGGDMSVAGVEFLYGNTPKISIYSWGYNDNVSNKTQASINELLTADSRDDVLLSTGNNFSVMRATSSYNVYSFGINDKWQLGRIQGAGSGYDAEISKPDTHLDGNKTDMSSGYVYTPYGEEQLINEYSARSYYQNNYFAKLATGNDFVVSIKKEMKADSSYTSQDKYAVYVWGNNANGQLGFANEDSNTNVRRGTALFNAIENSAMETDPNKVVPIQKEIIEVAAGSASGYAISSNGILYGWGDDSKHQLTSNKTANSTNNLVYKIANPQGATGYKKVWAGGDRVIALANDNNLYTWGDNNNGILGINSTEETVATPEKLYFSLAPIQ